MALSDEDRWHGSAEALASKIETSVKELRELLGFADDILQSEQMPQPWDKWDGAVSAGQEAWLELAECGGREAKAPGLFARRCADARSANGRRRAHMTEPRETPPERSLVERLRAVHSTDTWHAAQEAATRLAEAEARERKLRKALEDVYADAAMMAGEPPGAVERIKQRCRAALTDTASAGDGDGGAEYLAGDPDFNPASSADDVIYLGLRKYVAADASAGDVRRRALDLLPRIQSVLDDDALPRDEHDVLSDAADTLYALATPATPTVEAARDAAKVLDDLLSMKPEDAPFSVSELQGLWRMTAERKGFDAVRTFLRALSQQEGGENG